MRSLRILKGFAVEKTGAIWHATARESSGIRAFLMRPDAFRTADNCRQGTRRNPQRRKPTGCQVQAGGKDPGDYRANTRKGPPRKSPMAPHVKQV